MKTNIIKLGFFAALIIFIGCEDAIDIEQVGRLTPERSFRTVEDLSLGLNGAYTEYDMTPEITLNAEYTDELGVGNETGSQGFNTGFIFNLTSASTAAVTFWSNGYDETECCKPFDFWI